jgi:hypothetical protein
MHSFEQRLFKMTTSDATPSGGCFVSSRIATQRIPHERSIGSKNQQSDPDWRRN